MHLLFSENEKSDAEASAEEDEIFFGPVGHTEKCVASAVNEVAQASDKQCPLSPLTATQMAELCREAYTVAYQIEHADGSKPPSSHADVPLRNYSLTSHAKITGKSSNDETSNINPAEDLTSNVAETDRGVCLDEALSTSTCDDLASGTTDRRIESCDDKTSPGNSFEGLLSSLGSALPVIEPGSLKQDEHGVVKFTAAAAADSASSAGADAKCRTAIPAPSGLRRASSAKTSAVRSAGIPVKVLTVSQQ